MSSGTMQPLFLQLQHMGNTTCPDCGAPVAGIGFKFDSGSKPEIMQHCNGERWESVQYACGRMDTWLPNLHKSQTSPQCPKRPEAIWHEARRTAAKDALLAALDQLDVDDDFKRRVTADIRMHAILRTGDISE